MRAVLCHEFGPPDLLRIGETLLAALVPDAIRIKVVSAGVNFPDTLIIQGKYQKRPVLPFAPGFEVAGQIEEVGADVTLWQPGDQVVGLAIAGYGGYAEYADIRAREAVAIPAGVDAVTAAALYTAYGTAYHALIQRGRLVAGETVVVLGATGGVGLAAVDIATALGARVIAVGTSVDKLEIATQRGAAHALVFEDGSLTEKIRSLTGGRGADVCLDMVGGDAFAQMSRAMAWDGRLLVIGFTSGSIPSLPVNLLLLKGYAAIGVYWGRFVERSPETNSQNFDRLWQLLRDGQIAPHVHRTYSMEEARDALNDLLSRKTAGKLVLLGFAAR